MGRDCLECGMVVEELFAPCPTCGTRATDPNYRRGESKEAYDRTQGRATFMAHLKHRGTAAKNLQTDILTEVPVLSQSGGSYDAHVEIGKYNADIQAVRNLQANLVRKHGGGLPPQGPTRFETVADGRLFRWFFYFWFAIPFLELGWKMGRRYFGY